MIATIKKRTLYHSTVSASGAGQRMQPRYPPHLSFHLGKYSFPLFSEHIEEFSGEVDLQCSDENEQHSK